MKKIRVGGYARTSGEVQRGNTSIGTQIESIEAYCKARDYILVEVFIDESLSGSKTENRDAYLRMIQACREDKIDRVVCFDIDRLNRTNIIERANFFRVQFGVTCEDTKGFDNSAMTPNEQLQRGLIAEVKAFERLTILDRTTRGRIARAKAGQPWATKPMMRDYENGEWKLTEQAYQLRALVNRYIAGEPMSALCREYGFSSPQVVFNWINHPSVVNVVANIKADEIDVDVKIPMPMIPPILTEEQVKAAKVVSAANKCRPAGRLRKEEYSLSGFVKCGLCGVRLIGDKNNTRTEGVFYYRHKKKAHQVKPCFSSVRGDHLEEKVFSWLFGFFFDKPAFDKAIEDAHPNLDGIKKLSAQKDRLEKQLAKHERALKQLAKAISSGIDFDEIEEEAKSHQAAKNGILGQIETLDGQLAKIDMRPSQEEADAVRERIAKQLDDRDWRKLNRDEKREFLAYLFPKEEDGIFITPEGGITLQGQLMKGRMILWAEVEEIQALDEALGLKSGKTGSLLSTTP